MDLASRVTDALATVTDPELDRSLIELGFARAAVDDGGRVTVELRLPTYWCAANFAYLMASDARAAVAALPGVRSVAVRLLDHFAADELTDGVNAGRSFDEACGEDADGSGLDALRHLFRVKAFLARQERLLRRLAGEGRPPERICAMRLADLDTDAEDSSAYLERRSRLGLPVHPDAPLAVRPNGQAIPVERLAGELDRARLTRVSMQANTALCSGLFAARYQEEGGTGGGAPRKTGGPRGAARPPQAQGGVSGGPKPPRELSPRRGPAALLSAGGVSGDEDPPRSEGHASHGQQALASHHAFKKEGSA